MMFSIQNHNLVPRALGLMWQNSGNRHNHSLNCVLKSHLVSCPDYFSHAEGKNSLVNCLFNFCSVWFKNWWRTVFKNVLCDVTQSLKLRKSSKEMARCRDHPSRSFWMPRNEDSQSMKPLSTSQSPETILSTFESPGTSHCLFSSSETYTARSQKSWHSFASRALVLPGLVSCIVLQLSSLLWSPSIGVRDVVCMKQSDWSATIVVHGTKIE